MIGISFGKVSTSEVCLSGHKCNLTEANTSKLLRAAFHKYRASGGTSQKIDFVHILLIGSA